MWFVPLGPQRQSGWFFAFLQRLLEGSPPVLALLEHNPFPERPPRYIRVMAYEYHFTDREIRRATGAWWRRGEPQLFVRPLSLEMFRRE
jgi:hypothetical protein